METEIDKLTLSQKREHYEKLALVDLPDPEDVVGKLVIARNVVVNHHKSTSSKSFRKNSYKPLMKLTGANEETVKTAIATAKKKTRFCDISSRSKFVQTRHLEFLYETITNLYVEKRVVPTKQNIIDAIEDPNYDNRVLMNHLTSLGYMWKRLPRTDASVIVEKPEQLYKRIHYLQKMIEFRKNGRCLVYVRFTNERTKDEGLRCQNRAFAASPSLGLLNWSQYSTHQPRFEKWFWGILSPLLPKSCVVVLDIKTVTPDIISKVPTIDSTKAEMIRWLEANNIPHDTSCHRAELYKLVETYKRKNEQDLEAFDEYSKTYGHDFLIQPNEWSSLNYYRDIKESNMKSMKPEEWLEHEANLVQREAKIFQDSVKFEKIIDQLFTMATYEDLGEMCDKFEKYSSTDKYEHILL